MSRRGTASRWRRRAPARGSAPARRLAGLLHGGEHVADLAKLAVVGVERDDAGAAPVDLEGVPPGAAAKIEHPVAWPDGEPAEVHGQQCRSLREAARGGPAGAARGAPGVPR